MGKIRLICQILFAAITNGHLVGFLNGKIYKGKLKSVCVPGLSCYSCPGALGACPIGSLQGMMGSPEYRMTFYVIGTLILIGATLGRVVCGWMCPFGLVQDLLYKIPLFKKIKNLPRHNVLKYIKYIILIVFVILMPMYFVDIVGQGSPWFCKYICPSGTLFAGIPLTIGNSLLRRAIGWIFFWKNMILLTTVLLSIKVYRPFCKYICPLGAIYGCFNPVALYRYKIDDNKCIQCGECKNKCPMDITTFEYPNSTECIRCGECIKACPKYAIQTTIKMIKKQ